MQNIPLGWFTSVLFPTGAGISQNSSRFTTSLCNSPHFNRFFLKFSLTVRSPLRWLAFAGRLTTNVCLRKGRMRRWC